MHASVTPCQGGLTVAMQTAEDPSQLLLMRITGNPTVVSDAGEALEPVQSTLLCSVALPGGHELLQFLFEPLSAGILR